jgi:hypothetical protein
MTLLNMMINQYNKKSATHNYIFGFVYKKVVYLAYETEKILPFVTCIGQGSTRYNHEKVLRFQPNNEQKILLLQNATAICSEGYFEDLVKNTKYNRGEVFEKIVHEMNGQKWEKDRVPFWVGSDIEINGVGYQIKFQKASFASESKLHKLNMGD